MTPPQAQYRYPAGQPEPPTPGVFDWLSNAELEELIREREHRIVQTAVVWHTHPELDRPHPVATVGLHDDVEDLLHARVEWARRHDLSEPLYAPRGDRRQWAGE